MAEVAQREQQLVKLVRVIAAIAGGIAFVALYNHTWESMAITAAVVFIAWYKIESWIQSS